MSLSQKRALVSEDRGLSVEKQCQLLELGRSSYYYRPGEESAQNLALMKHIDRLYTAKPYLGRRRIAQLLRLEGFVINEKRIGRLMGKMGLQAIYPRKKSKRGANNEAVVDYPCLIRQVSIKGPNVVWCTDITYVPMEKGFMYLTAIMDWYSRYVLSWRVSNSLEVGFCLEALDEALGRTTPKVLNSDKGSQYTSQKYLGCLEEAGVDISMSQRGCWDNLLVERLWRRVKYEDLYLHSYEDGWALEEGLRRYFEEYNEVVPHSALDGKRPGEVWRSGPVL